MYLDESRQLLKCKLILMWGQLLIIILLYFPSAAEPFYSSFISYHHNAFAVSDDTMRHSLRSSYNNRRYSTGDSEGTNVDFILVKSGETARVADISGAGEITHLWCTLSGEDHLHRFLVLKMYWDNSPTPGVNAPIGDFFLQPHGKRYEVVTLPFINTSWGNGRNCYFRMPFKERAVLTLTNHGTKPAVVYFHIDYRSDVKLKEPVLYFHAQYHQQFPTDGWYVSSEPQDLIRSSSMTAATRTRNPAGEGNYKILETTGEGYYMGCLLAVHPRSPGWWGEGDEMVFIDDDTTPSLQGTGTEDYFGNAWGLRVKQTPLTGVIDYAADKKFTENGAYRFHLEDPVRFRESIRVTIEHGHNNSRTDDYSSVAYWYCTRAGHDFGYLPTTRNALSTYSMRARRELLKTLKKSGKLQSNNEIETAINELTTFIEHYDTKGSLCDKAKLKLGIMYIKHGYIEKANELLAPLYNKGHDRKFHQLVSDLLFVLESPDNALLMITGDDVYTAWLDGEELVKGNLYDELELIRVRLTPGKHTLLVEVKNVLLFGGVCAELLSINGSHCTDSSWEVVTPPPTPDPHWQQRPDTINGWEPATEYHQQWEAWFTSDNITYYKALGLQAYWIWDKKNFINHTSKYFRTDFMYRGEMWQRQLRYHAGKIGSQCLAQIWSYEK